jgi:hypothetical protein
VTTGGALPASSSHQRVTAIVRASGALVALGPAARGQVLLAGLFVGELKLKLAEAWQDGSHDRHDIACSQKLHIKAARWVRLRGFNSGKAKGQGIVRESLGRSPGRG